MLVTTSASMRAGPPTKPPSRPPAYAIRRTSIRTSSTASTTTRPRATTPLPRNWPGSARSTSSTKTCAPEAPRRFLEDAAGAQQRERGDGVVDAAVDTGGERVVEAYANDLDAFDLLRRQRRGRQSDAQIQLDRLLHDRGDLVRAAQRAPAHGDDAGFLARLALRAGQAVLTRMPAAFDHFEHDCIEREPGLARKQHVLAVEQHDRARARRHHHAMHARRAVGVDHLVRFEAQPRVLVDDALGKAAIAGVAHGVAYANSVRPSGSSTAAISSGFDFQ